MYRQYENPIALQDELYDKKNKYLTRLAQCESEDEKYELVEMYTEIIAELEERINFAWQDEEFDRNFSYC